MVILANFVFYESGDKTSFYYCYLYIPNIIIIIIVIVLFLLP